MIAVIIALLATAFGAWLFLKEDGTWCEQIGGGIFAVSSVALVVMVFLVIDAHVGVDNAIEKNRIKHESLCERYEIITSEYEDVSRSDIINDIAEWNMDVYTYKYWAYNPWTNWFYSRRVADELEMIGDTDK
jgi:hypothetical protein